MTPGDDCTPFGGFVPCGLGEFPPECGPGTVCSVDRCFPSDECTAVACDAIHHCRGVGCSGAFGEGEIDAVTVSPIEPAPAGTRDGIHVEAHVAGRSICGLDATIELRVETAIITSAGDDATIWAVDPQRYMRSPRVTGIRNVGGITADAAGIVHFVRSDTCDFSRVSPGATRWVVDHLVHLPGDALECTRVTVGLDGAFYAAVSTIVYRIDPFTFDLTRYGTLGPASPGGHEPDPFISGLAFGRAGELYVADYWPDILVIPPGGGDGAPFAIAPRTTTFAFEDNPWTEGLAIGPDDLLYGAVFPIAPDGGFIYRVGMDGSTSVVLDHADLVDPSTGLPRTAHAGLHAVAFGLDGSMYFTNQNSDHWLDGLGDPRDPFGQIAAQRPDGTLELVSEGIDFDYYQGFDGDLVVATRLTDVAVVPIRLDGSVGATFDVPDEAGSYGVRVFVTDPTSGEVFADAAGARAP